MLPGGRRWPHPDRSWQSYCPGAGPSDYETSEHPYWKPQTAVKLTFNLKNKEKKYILPCFSAPLAPTSFLPKKPFLTSDFSARPAPTYSACSVSSRTKCISSVKKSTMSLEVMKLGRTWTIQKPSAKMATRARTIAPTSSKYRSEAPTNQ